jgi:Dinucleotide-utilizing enzymes involved in molybdopterin and thiamine biosynthesis family 1
MSERIREINPAAKVTVHAVFADNQNFERLLENGPDTVIDAIDSLNPKTELISFCVARGIPIISSMGAGARLDPLAVRAGDISEIHTCALARRIRRQLKRNHGIDTGLRCVYSIEKPRKPAVAPKIEEEYYQRGRRRIPVGTISYLPAMFGLMISSEVMSLLIGEQGAA